MELTILGAAPPPLARPGRLNATLVSLLLGLWIAVGELDHLLSQLVDVQQSWSPNGISGPLVLTSLHDHGRTDAGAGWAFLGGAAPPHWLFWYGVLDALLAVAYTWLLLRAIWRVRHRRPPRPPGGGAPGPSRHLYSIALNAVVVGGTFDVIEDVFIAGGARAPYLLPYLSTVKWLGLLVGVGSLLVLARPFVGGWLGNGLKAIYTHRYSFLVVLPVAALGVARGPDLLEQVPDIQRAWLDEGGASDFLASATVSAILVVVTFVIGRQRTGHLWERTAVARDDQMPGLPRPRPLILVWLVGPVLLGAAAVVTMVATDAHVGWWRLVLFSVLPVAIAGVSWWMRHRGLGTPPPERPTVNPARFRAASWMGDVLPASLLVVAGLGAVRAFTGVLALGQLSAFGVALLALGWLVLLVAWPVWDGWLRSLVELGNGLAEGVSPPAADRALSVLIPGAEVRDVPGTAIGPQRLAWASLVAGIAGVVTIALLPVPLSHALGVMATFQLALGALSLLVAAIVILFQAGGAPEALWPLRLRFVPVTTLVVVVSAFAGTFAGADVHGIRTTDQALPQRPTMVTLFEAWLAGGPDCGSDLEVGGKTITVRALPLYAAEGGGIRAAWWTAAAVDEIQATAAAAGHPSCADAFLSSGASGGSVGLSIASTVGRGDATDATTSIAGPDALGAATDGLVLRDTIYAATGVPVPSLFGDDYSENPWSDRGTLIEKAWSAPAQMEHLDDYFVRSRGSWEDWAPVGGLVLNTTSSTTSCRALLSQVVLERPEAPGAGDCWPPTGVAASIDLLDCTEQLRTTTAALLTARFPYVTPSGVVSCPEDTGARADKQQIVDGGYAENFGIGTLVDLAPQFMDVVRKQNACALRGGCSATLVVPTLIYFDNGTGSDLLAKPRGLRLEIAVPPATLLTAKAALVSARAQLQRAEATFASDQLVDPTVPGAAEVAEQIDTWRHGHAAYVVYQATEPGIAAPLGWVLSDASICAMERSLGPGGQSKGFGFGTLDDFTRTALGTSYTGTEPTHCD